MQVHEWGGVFTDIVTYSHFRQFRPGLRIAINSHGGHYWSTQVHWPSCNAAVNMELHRTTPGYFLQRKCQERGMCNCQYLSKSSMCAVMFEECFIEVTRSSSPEGIMVTRQGQLPRPTDIMSLRIDNGERATLEYADIALSPTRYIASWLRQRGWRLPDYR